jgi:hypothetical protein
MTAAAARIPAGKPQEEHIIKGAVKKFLKNKTTRSAFG